MFIRDVMTRGVTMIDMDTSITEAARLMREAHVGFLPVLEEHVCAGVLTDRDIVLRVVAEGRDPGATTAAMVMSHGVPTPDRHELGGNMSVAALYEDVSVDEAIDVMNKLDVQRILVYDGSEQIIGVVSRHDLPCVAREMHEVG
jgi:CBS domain-containing protein